MTFPDRLSEYLTLNPDLFDAVVFDVDGVVHSHGLPLPGAAEALKSLKDRGLPYTFLTNDGNHSPAEKAAILRATGLPIDPAEIVSCGHALKGLVREREWTGRLFFIMGDLGRPCYAEAAGLEVTRDPDRLSEAFGVIVGEEDYDWETVINLVVNFFIERPEAPLVVPNTDVFFPGGRLRIRIGAGGTAGFILSVLREYGLEIETLGLGKPSRPIFDFNHARLEKRLGRSLDRDRVLMVGDNLETDVRGGAEFGYRTALVLTGVTDRRRLAASTRRPDLVFESI